jgi:hypothetical protein
MQQPRKSANESKQDQGAPHDESGDEEILLPPFHMLPRSLRKLLFTGSCCAGVAVLYFAAAVDHGWIPGLNSSFAAAAEVKDMKSDLNEMYIHSLGRAIRDLSEDNCTAHSRALDDQINALRLKYIARTGADYPHSECKKL